LRLDGVIVASNPAAGQLLGRDPADLLGSVFFAAIHRDDVEDVEQRYAGLLAGGTPVLRHECRLRPPGGRGVWVSVSISRLPESDGRVEHVVVHIEDVSERKQREADLSHQALYDPLTGLANRALLIERIREAPVRSRPARLLPAAESDDVGAVGNDDEERTYRRGWSSRWRRGRHAAACRSGARRFAVVTVTSGCGRARTR